MAACRGGECSELQAFQADLTAQWTLGDGSMVGAQSQRHAQIILRVELYSVYVD